MRHIQKSCEPVELTEWRARYQNDPNFGYGLLRQDHTVINALTEILLKEQGWLCAYTGLRIERDSCHIEHLKAQAHCERGEDVDYHNVVACYPAPNQGEAPYGAHQKKSWPDSNERHLFVSPLDEHCEERFLFNFRGEIKPQNDHDSAARRTIEKLKLDHSRLTALRKSAIQGTLGKARELPLKDARRRLRILENQTSGHLDPFVFALKQALRKHIRQIEIIVSDRKKKP